jgi:hypothetical protein
VKATIIGVHTLADYFVWLKDRQHPPWLTYNLYALLRKRSSLVTIFTTRFVMNTQFICCLPLNTIDEFLVSRFVDVKRVQYKDLTLLQIYHC